MSERSSYEDGHLLVAAIRLLEYRNGILPREEDLSEFLEWHIDHVRVLLRSLRDRGITAEVRSAHDLRIRIADHLELEKLEREPGVEDEISRELAAFKAKVDAEYGALDALFEASQEPKSEKKTKLEAEYERYRQSKPKNPFADD